MSTSLPPLLFIPMLESHVPLVGELDKRNYVHPWSEHIFRDCLKSGYVGQLAMLEEQCVGYGVIQFAAGEAHILNLCIDQPWQRKGLARKLLGHLIELAKVERASIIFLEVRPSNPRAVELYEHSGFNEIGLRKGYYNAEKGREDALVMALSLVYDEDVGG